MKNSILVCEGVVTISDEMPYCDTGWLVQPYSVPFSYEDIQTEDASFMFAAGFALFIFPWAVAWGIKQMLSLLR